MRSRRTDLILAGLLAAVSYIPLLCTRPGMVAADTKQYLYLDPARLTSGAASMWDPNTGLGTVTHQNIGYLFPMGPFFTAMKWLGIPTWVAQRLWMGTVLFAAGAGVAYCARRLGLEGLGRWVPAFGYMLSPYIIDYLGRTSAILLPWAALGWFVGLTVMAARTNRWRYPALFGLVVALVGGVNATSIILVLIAPAVWLAYEAVVTKEVSLKRAATVGGRIAVLSVGVSLWWAAGLWAEGRYGINVLRVTETVPTVSRTSSAAEVLRGLGYWYFYGWDKVQPWTLASVDYSQSLWLLTVSYLVPATAVIVGFFARWRYRAFCVLLVLSGTLVAVGAYPYSHPSGYGAALKGASSGSTVALALRSVDRVVPIVVLGLALMMGAGIASIRLARPGAGLVAAGACMVLVVGDLPPLWTGDLIASNLERPSRIPGYWNGAATYLNSSGTDRVLGLPGEDFAAYAWGVTEDPVAPGLLDRPYVQRQVVPSGSPASADLLQALDEPLQEGVLDMSAVAPIARMMSASQILLQSDLQYERYHLPLPQVLWRQMTSPAAGLSGPITFGGPNPAPVIRYPLNSEVRLGLPTRTAEPPALAVFGVSDPLPLVRAEPATQPVIVAGDGRGLVEASAAGLLGAKRPVLYSASYSDPAALKAAAAPGATLVLSDTNTLSTNRWGGLRDNTGQVDQPGVTPLSSSPSDYSLSMFPGVTDSTQTIAQIAGIKAVRATGYGDSLSFTPEDRPVNALDGDPSTAWTFGAHSPVAGARIRIDLLHPVGASRITLLQAQLERPNRRIRRVTLTFDGRRRLTARLNASSYSAPGQTITFPPTTFQRLDVTIDSANGGRNKIYDGLSAVGFAEIAIPGLEPAVETLRMPSDLLGSLGGDSASHPLYILMNRQREVEVPRHDPELQISRSFDLPTPRTFTVGGTAEINSADSDDLINRLIGVTPLPSVTSDIQASASRGNRSQATIVAANSSTRLDADRAARANAAGDDNPATAWIAETGPQAGEWLGFLLNRPVTFDHLDLQLLNDGRHSLPSRITVTTENGSRTVDLNLPPTGYGRPFNSTSAVPVRFAPISGASIKVTIDGVREVPSLDYYSTFAGQKDVLPVGIAELGVPGTGEPSPPTQLPAACEPGLLSIDGSSVDVEVTGTTSDAIAGRSLQVRPCGNSISGIHLAAGTHTVKTSSRLPSGWSIDFLNLASVPVPVTSPAPAPAVRVLHHDRTSWDVRVTSDGAPFWLVLGQSFNQGWEATLHGHSLGAARLVDGFATGWRVPASAITGVETVHIEWRPQRVVWVAIGVSALFLLLCVALAVWPARNGTDRFEDGDPDPGASRHPLASRIHPLCPVGGTRPPWTSVAGWSVGWGVAAALASRPLIGAASAVAVACGCVFRPGRAAVRFAATLSMLAVPVYVVQQQASHHYLPTIDWPAAISSANDIAWFALAMVGADLAAGGARAIAVRGRSANTLSARGRPVT